METILVTMAFFVLAIGFMAAALNFAKYKKRKSACCGGGSCATNFDKKDYQKEDERTVNIQAMKGSTGCCNEHAH